MGVNEIARLVVERRNHYQFRQEDLAGLAGVSQKALSQLENAKPSIQLVVVAKIMAALGINAPFIDHPMTRAQAIRSARKRIRLSLEDVSGLTGISIRYLSLIECGKENISLQLLLKLLDTLGLDVMASNESINTLALDESQGGE